VSSLYFYLLLNVIALRNLLMTFRQYPEVIAKVSYLLLYSIALGTLSLSPPRHEHKRGKLYDQLLAFSSKYIYLTFYKGFFLL